MLVMHFILLLGTSAILSTFSTLCIKATWKRLIFSHSCGTAWLTFIASIPIRRISHVTKLTSLLVKVIQIISWNFFLLLYWFLFSILTFRIPPLKVNEKQHVFVSSFRMCSCVANPTWMYPTSYQNPSFHNTNNTLSVILWWSKLTLSTTYYMQGTVAYILNVLYI